MPIKIGDKSFKKFHHAEAYIKRTKPGVASPGGYVAAIEKKQKEHKKGK